MGQPRRKQPAVIERLDRQALRQFLSRGGQQLLPLVELVEQTGSAIEQVIDVVGRATVEAVLWLSAKRRAGPQHPGKQIGAIRWFGSQPGSVRLADRKLRVRRPRLRRKGRATGREVRIPAYTALRQGGIGEHVLRLLMRGVSTRNYAQVLTTMADTAGVSKSAISREWIELSARQLESLLERRWDETDILIVYLDGMVFGDQHVLAAVGVDRSGAKHVLGVVPGSSENARVAKDLLCNLIERGLAPDRLRLFVIDGQGAAQGDSGGLRRRQPGPALPRAQAAERDRAAAAQQA